MTKIRYNARILCVLAIALLAGMMCIALPTARAEGNVALIDPSARGSLTVVKSAGDPFSQFGNPQRAGQPEPVKPIEGLVFKAQKIDGVDLTTTEGWQQVTDLQVGDVVPTGSEHHRLTEGVEATTDASGHATFTDLDLGLYYVTELPGPAQEQGFTTVAPFIVAVPTTAEDGTSWNYHVSINAKDQKLVGSKAAAQKCVEAGQDVQFGMSGTLPAPTGEGALARYDIVDPLAPELDYAGGDEAFLTDVAAGDVTTPLDDADFTTHVDGSLIRFALTESGLAKAAAMRMGNPEVLVTWRFMVKVNAQPEEGKVRNKGYILPPGFPEFDVETTPGIPTNQVTVSVGECANTPDTTPVQTPQRTPYDNPDRGRTPPIVPVPLVPVPVPGPGIPGHPEEYDPRVPQVLDATPPEDVVVPAAPTDADETYLAMTGANVLRFAGAGLLLLIIGGFLAARTKREGEQ